MRTFLLLDHDQLINQSLFAHHNNKIYSKVPLYHGLYIVLQFEPISKFHSKFPTVQRSNGYRTEH